MHAKQRWKREIWYYKALALQKYYDTAWHGMALWASVFPHKSEVAE